MKRIVACLLLAGCMHAPSPRPEAIGPPMRVGAWRLTYDGGTLPWLCIVRPNAAHILLPLEGGLCSPDLKWRREDKTHWLFESRCGSAQWGATAVGRAVGDFRTGFAATLRVRAVGEAASAQPGERIVHIQGRYVAWEPCPNL